MSEIDRLLSLLRRATDNSEEARLAEELVEQREREKEEAWFLFSVYALDRLNKTPEQRVGLAESLINDLMRIIGTDLC